MKKGLLIMALLSLLFGCKEKEPQPLTGEHHYSHDDTAPSVIVSENIESFCANYYNCALQCEEYNGFFRVTVMKNEDGQWELKEEKRGISVIVKEDFLQAVQMIVKENNLVKQNGVYSVTDGLPEEYQPCSVTVVYDSGEKLYFTVKNEPEGAWHQKLTELVMKQAE
ncbi:MAG: hypothetical protein HUJ58_02330 [Erysipelotrichaceae bacterium]|nr:hypothetical protein [Erysipelotrichaceae bacterium]